MVADLDLISFQMFQSLFRASPNRAIAAERFFALVYADEMREEDIQTMMDLMTSAIPVSNGNDTILMFQHPYQSDAMGLALGNSIQLDVANSME